VLPLPLTGTQLTHCNKVATHYNSLHLTATQLQHTYMVASSHYDTFNSLHYFTLHRYYDVGRASSPAHRYAISTLQHTCNTLATHLQHATSFCIILQHATHLQRTAIPFSPAHMYTIDTLQHTCNTLLRHTYNTPQHFHGANSTHYNTLQLTATHCNTFATHVQHTATLLFPAHRVASLRMGVRRAAPSSQVLPDFEVISYP